MENRKNKVKLISCWSIISASLIAITLVIYHLAKGEIPISQDLTNLLPFGGISRWWDVLIGPIWVTFVTLLFFDREKKLRLRLLNRGDRGTLLAGLVLGLFIGFFFGIGFGLAVGLGVGLFFGLAVGFISCRTDGLAVGIGMSLVLGLGFGLSIGVAGILVFGLIFGLVNNLISANFWIKAWDWLIAK